MTTTPEWLDTTEYPFASHYMDLPAGKMHYVDQGQGPVILFIHGTPSWSFEYRHLIKALSKEYRCIAPDHIGFGLSDKPYDWTYRPEDHAKNLALFIEKLGLDSFYLMVHDFGGPIGLSYAIDHPEKVKKLVVANTWLWDVREEKRFKQAGKMLGGGFGRFLYKHFNFSPKVLVKKGWGNKKTLTKNIHNHYTKPFPKPNDRKSTWVLAYELLASGPWYNSLWQQRDKIKDIPVLFTWGMKDEFFTKQDLDRLQGLFSQATLEAYPNAGHFPQDEEPGMHEALNKFLKE